MAKSQGLFVFLILCHICRVCPKILAAFVMPHGGIALDPGSFNTTNATAKAEGWKIHNACAEVGQQITSLQPDLVFLSTPHGVSDLRNFVFYLNPLGQGYADTDNCQCPPCCYSLAVNLDAELSQELIQKLGGTKGNLSGLTGFGPPGQSSEPFPLRWGEVIPLYFIPGLNRSKVIILSQPSRRYTNDISMMPELLTLGNELYMALDSLPQQVVVIISGDLAHTHEASGPYGYSNASEPFDEACGKWAATLSSDTLLISAAGFVDRALSCGFTGFVMLQGMLMTQGTDKWRPKLLVNHHPSYYGMMVASFLRQGA